MTKLKLATVVVFLLGTTVGAGVLLGRTADGRPAAGPEAPRPGQAPAQKSEGGKPGEAPRAAGDLAGRLWAILEVVERNHAQPPPRQEMILRGAQALLKAANTAPPEDLARRASAVAGEDQLRTFLRDIWPTDSPAPAGKLENALLDGLFDSVPGRPHLQSEATLRLHDQLRGNRYVGIGVQLAADEREKLPQIAIPFRRGAARRAGALPGDLLLEVDGKSTRGMMDLEKVVALLRGAEGTSVTLVVRQPGAAATRTLTMTRTVIPIDSVLGFRRAGEEGWDYCVDPQARIAYVWVKSLKASTLHELRQVERRLQADGMRALVLDFRFSQGDGLLHDAGLVAAGLLDGGLMWTAREQHYPPKAWRAERDCLFHGWPVVVLVNGVEDNAQGAVLAALQDNRRALLVGEPTKADGAIRRRFPLPNEQGSLAVLTGQLERADRSRGWPVRPDRTVALTREQRSAVEQWLQAKQLPVLPAGTDDRPPEDPQLAAGVAVLRDSLKGAGPAEKRDAEGGK